MDYEPLSDAEEDQIKKPRRHSIDKTINQPHNSQKTPYSALAITPIP